MISYKRYECKTELVLKQLVKSNINLIHMNEVFNKMPMTALCYSQENHCRYCLNFSLIIEQTMSRLNLFAKLFMCIKYLLINITQANMIKVLF